MSDKSACLVLYVPVIHRGYIDLLLHHNDVDEVFVVGESLLNEVGYKEKDIRAINPYTAKSILQNLVSSPVTILELGDMDRVSLEFKTIRLASDEVTRALGEKYWDKRQDMWWVSAFLRWDTEKVFSLEPAGYDRVSEEIEDNAILELAAKVSGKTSDWWRQVGAVVVQGGKVTHVVYNRHLPSEHTPYILGDPRDFVKAGERSELASAVHCEQQIVAQAAKEGRSLEGASLYLQVFPCPVCAKIVALSGIKQCYFSSGHASLDGLTILKAFGVELVFVKKLPDYQAW